jgi:hypothetical protein
MNNAIKLTEVTIARARKGTSGAMEYTGVAKYRCQSKSLTFEYAYHFDQEANIADAIERGCLLLKQELEHLVVAAANIPAILSNP